MMCLVILHSKQPNFSSIIEHCNLWRNFDDIQDSWTSLESIIDYYGNNQDAIVPNAGPGHWNDPDMVNRSHTFQTIFYFYFFVREKSNAEKITPKSFILRNFSVDHR